MIKFIAHIKGTDDSVFLNAFPGETVLRVIQRNGLSIYSPCGGEGTCGKCRIRILEGEKDACQHQTISMDEQSEGISLACMTKVDRIREIEIGTFQNFGTSCSEIVSVETTQWKSILKKFMFEPFVREKIISITESSNTDYTCFLERIFKSIEPETEPHKWIISRKTINEISELSKKRKHDKLSVKYSKNLEFLDVRPYKRRKKNIGITFDIGTTTVAGLLIDLENCEILSKKSCYNRQIHFGEDVIHRIIFASKNSGARILQKQILNTLNTLLLDMCSGADINPDQVLSISIAGNVTMIHLLLGLYVDGLRQIPQQSVVTKPPIFSAREIGIKTNLNAKVFIVPGVANYIGGDIIGGIVASGFFNDDSINIYVDIGTNCEIVLGNASWIVGCAASAGPAFEGIGIACGMRAADGAIENIILNNHGIPAEIKVIGDVKPKGISGTGLLSLLSELFHKGVIDQKGKFTHKNAEKRLFNDSLGWAYFIVNDAVNLKDGILLKEKEIQTLLRSKAAIWAGMCTLTKMMDINFNSVKKIIIAGGFGKNLNIKHAVRIGMLPNLPVDKYFYLGNGSLLGAAINLISEKARMETREKAKITTYIDLSTNSAYMEEFIASLFLPHTDKTLFWEEHY